jgi:GNAT superfamily N-acetyltransferase
MGKTTTQHQTHTLPFNTIEKDAFVSPPDLGKLVSPVRYLPPLCGLPAKLYRKREALEIYLYAAQDGKLCRCVGRFIFDFAEGRMLAREAGLLGSDFVCPHVYLDASVRGKGFAYAFYKAALVRGYELISARHTAAASKIWERLATGEGYRLSLVDAFTGDSRKVLGNFGYLTTPLATELLNANDTRLSTREECRARLYDCLIATDHATDHADRAQRLLKESSAWDEVLDADMNIAYTEAVGHLRLEYLRSIAQHEEERISAFIETLCHYLQ